MSSKSPQHHTVDSVVYLLDWLQPYLCCPMTSTTTAQLASLCVGLKQVGRHLESQHSTKLDTLQTVLAGLCQDSRLDIVLRLRLLEVIELRTLKWEVTPVMEKYYKERFQQLQLGGGKQMLGSQDQEILQRRGNSARDDIPTETETPVDSLEVKDVLIYLRSDNPVSIAKAKKVLADFFSNDTSVFPKVQYSREKILSLSTGDMAHSPPDQWDTLSQSLPSVLLRSKGSVLQGEGDGSRLSCKSSVIKSSDVLPDSLPVIKRQ